jgi:formylglycine-generating enzyme required for sulfatase activity
MKKLLLMVAIWTISAAATFGQSKSVEIYRNGNVIYSEFTSAIDSITFVNRMATPTGVMAALSNGNTAITVTWGAVSGATSYEVYRSRDNATYSLLTTVSATTCTDNAPVTGQNYYKVKAKNANLESALSLASAAVTYGGSDLETGLYMGIIGFNQALTTKNISLLSEDTKASFKSVVSGMTSQNGTVLYYAVDNAIDKLVETPMPADLVNVAIVTFTDGLDQGSHMLNREYGGDDAAYLSAIKNRIDNVRIQGLEISAYSIGIRGNDVSDVQQFQSNLQNLASAPANATDVTRMEEVNAKFEEIADLLYNESSTQSISLKILGQANGSLIRFTFDDVSDAANSTVYIEGTFSFVDNKLNNVTYAGCSSASGSTVNGVVEGPFVTYTFEDVKQTSGENLPAGHIQQWRYIPATSTWQINSEFTPDGNTEIIVDRKSAVIMLVLDCSSSLGNQFATMQTNANAFIDKMAEGLSGTGGGQAGSGAYTANGVSFDMIAVPGGTFQMGSTSGDPDERPVHSVTLSNFSIGKYEVTQQLWLAVMGSWPSTAPGSSYGNGNNYPAYNVSWDDIVGTSSSQAGYTVNGVTYYQNGFCYKLSSLVGSGLKFCLPTEAQWEYAAKGGQQSHNYTYSGSNTIGDVAWYDGNSSSTTHAVGTKAANELGIYDMSGNVWEWCSDWYASSYSSGAQTNPAGASSGTYRVLRGGSWYYNAGSCRVAYRSYNSPGFRNYNLGFRLACSSE